MTESEIQLGDWSSDVCSSDLRREKEEEGRTVLKEKRNATFGDNPHKTVGPAKQHQMPLNNSHSRDLVSSKWQPDNERRFSIEPCRNR
jgi:hypothetical protein